MRPRVLSCTPLLMALLLGCPRVPPPAKAPAEPAKAPANPEVPMSDPAAELSRLAAEYWEANLAAGPEGATMLGDHRYDDRLSDNSAEGIAREEQRYRKTLERVRAIPADRLSPADRVTRTALEEELDRALRQLSCALHEWTISSSGGPHVSFANLVELTPLPDVAAARLMVKRFSGAGRSVDNEIAHLRRGLAASKVANRHTIETVIGQLDALAAEPVDAWPLVRAADRIEGAAAAEKEEIRTQLAGIVEREMRPAFRRYRDCLATELLPSSRDDDHPGLAHLPGGLACYTELVRNYTTLPLSAEEVHRTGLEEVARLRGELSALGAKALGTSDVPEIQRKLRTDPEMHFRTREEVEKKAADALAKAREAIPRWFGRLPKAPCDVIRIAEYEEKDTTIAYYREPSMDGVRPGHYYINTYAPETRPRYEAEVLAYHESIPGHHLQIAIAQELEGIPEFRKHEAATAFVEGWGLYSERLSDEMGLYSSDVDRLGVLSFDLWRACRLVVDTGIHAKGWGRKKAIDYMVANTLLAENNVANEVDRYINWPGQALAYKTGQREIFRLRDEAKKALGDRFDIRRFHDVVLGNGGVSLPALRQAVEDWIAAERGSGKP